MADGRKGDRSQDRGRGGRGGPMGRGGHAYNQGYNRGGYSSSNQQSLEDHHLNNFRGGRGGFTSGRGVRGFHASYSSERLVPRPAETSRSFESRPRRDSERSRTSDEFKEPTPGG